MIFNILSKYLIISTSVLFLSQTASPQQVGFTLTSGHKRTDIPFENFNNLIIIPVTLKGILPCKFILDSGVSTNILTERSLCDILGVTCDRMVSIPVIGSREKIDACVIGNIDMTLPGISGKNLNMLVLEEDFLNLRNYLGINVFGIIGFDILRHFVVKIDFTTKMLTFITPEHFRPPKRYLALKVEFENNKPYLAAGVNLTGDTIIPCRLMVDLGASHTILFELPENNDIRLPFAKINAAVGRGLGGDIEGFFTRIHELSLGNFTLTDVVVSFSPDYKINDKTDDPILQGTLGGEILSRFDIILDYFNKKIYLKKNYTYIEPFEYNLSGIELIASGTDLKKFEVISVLPGSPAEKAGIKNGNLILAVNGISAIDLTLNEINHTLRSKPGRMVKLKIDSNGQILKVKFRLEKMI
ncbi:MAG: aspartyl protease family protein [Bacteroidetes bacterium]|nr:aspartyl protease family protein [Bacteroidota bacterium]